jgi:hypothetical protein
MNARRLGFGEALFTVPLLAMVIPLRAAIKLVLALVIYGAMRRWSPQHFRATLR